MSADTTQSGKQAASATVLYVDDEELAQKYFLRTFGTDYGIYTAANVDTAIELLRDTTKQIDIVVTDYRMPVRDGGELLRHIELEFPHIIRIVVTAYANREVLLGTLNSGKIFRILEKPLDTVVTRLPTKGQGSEFVRQQRRKINSSHSGWRFRATA